MTVQLSWNANGETDLAGYRVYSGNSSGNYSQVPLSVGVASAQLTVADGLLWYFAVTAIDTSGNESNFSNEVTRINRYIAVRL